MSHAIKSSITEWQIKIIKIGGKEVTRDLIDFDSDVNFLFIIFMIFMIFILCDFILYVNFPLIISWDCFVRVWSTSPTGRAIHACSEAA